MRDVQRPRKATLEGAAEAAPTAVAWTKVLAAAGAGLGSGETGGGTTAMAGTKVWAAAGAGLGSAETGGGTTAMAGTKVWAAAGAGLGSGGTGGVSTAAAGTKVWAAAGTGLAAASGKLGNCVSFIGWAECKTVGKAGSSVCEVNRFTAWCAVVSFLIALYAFVVAFATGGAPFEVAVGGVSDFFVADGRKFWGVGALMGVAGVAKV
jgi:hypothetical protein